jgi:hypothetical protein
MNEIIKDLITQTDVTINKKYIPTYTVKDHANFQFNTNHPDAFYIEEPVLTKVLEPCERVLFYDRRDANPIFHLMESIWMLSGSDDATWIDQFVSDFSARYAEPGGRMHGAYGRRGA